MNVSATLRSYLIGTGSSVWGIENITGLDDLVIKSNDVDLHFADGVTSTRDYLGATPIIIDAKTRAGTSQAGAEAAIHALRSAWLPATVDLTCSISFAGTSHSITGRPRGATFDRSQQHAGLVRAQLTFLDTK